jgi:quaternary ammonium compound-resistance protein SugE
VIVGALLFDEALNGWKLLLVTTLIIGIIGLKQVTGGEEA